MNTGDGTITMIKPAVNVELLEVRIVEKAVIPQTVAAMPESPGGAATDVVAAPVVIPGWTHP